MANIYIEDMLAPLVGNHEFRLRWWRELEAAQPDIAARLVAKFPERYPIR